MAEYAQLVVQRGPEPGRGYMLVRAVLTIGRDPGNDIVINHAEVSRQHTRIVRQGDQVVVEDMGSTNGTFVNGVLLTNPHTLTDGDVIGLGDSVTLGYEAVDAATAKTVVERRQAAPAPAAEPKAAAPSAPEAVKAEKAVKKEDGEEKPKRPRWVTCGCIALVVACIAVVALAWWMDANHPDILYAPLEWLGLR